MKYGNYGSGKRRFNVRRSPLALIAVFIVFAVIAKATWSIHQKAVISEAKLSEAQGELTKLQVRQSDLQSEVSSLSTEQGLEAELRTKYRAVKDGESVAVIVDSDQTAAASDASSTPPHDSWQQQVLHLFGL